MILVGLTAVGTLGMMLTGDRSVFDALYLTVVILTTVGMDRPITEADRVWAIVLMIVGIGAVLYATGQMVSFVIEGQFKQIIGRRKVTERIRKLNGHFLIAGFGRMGHALCNTLAFRERAFVLIESDPRKVREAEELGYLCIEGDATHDAILLEAGIERASGLVTCLPHDA
ncbi:MAG: NAD-binding protein, partial [Phycisphaerales bacterium]